MQDAFDARDRPHDLNAEKAVLGSMINWPTVCIDRATKVIVAADFYDPRHALVFQAVLALSEARRPVEPAALNSTLTASGEIGRAGGAGYLLELVRSAGTPSGMDFYLGIVAETAMRRALVVMGHRVVQRACTRSDETAAEIAEWAALELKQVVTGTGSAVEDPGLGPEDLLVDAPPHDWVIPYLIERGDRLMITGEEGAGKSTLTRQIAVAAAAGLNPFTLRDTGHRARVLVIDCENGHNLTLRRYRPLIQAAARDSAQGITAAKFQLHLEPKGLDLTQRAGQGWLLSRVRAFLPDLLVIGPLYRLQTADPSDEVQARRVAAALDAARDVCNSALVIETHAGHGSGMSKQRNLRPIGSSLWLRWPEFGYGIHKTDDKDDPAGWSVRLMDVKPWRGPRDERSWPRRIRAQGAPTGWSWITDDAPPLGGW